MKRLPTLLLVLALLPVAAVAVAAPPTARALPTIDLPPWPDSQFARRLQGHEAEANARPQQSMDPQLPSTAGWTAANYSKLIEPKWSILHQDITVEVEPDKPLIRVWLVVKVRPKVGESITKMRFRSEVMDLDTLEVKDAAGNELQHKLVVQSQIYGRLDVDLPAPLTEGVDTDISVSYAAELDCDSQYTMLKSCSFDKEFQSVMFFSYYLRHGEAGHAPFISDLHVVTDVGYTAAAPGVPSGPDTLQSGRLLWHFKQLERTENAGFVIAKYEPKGDPIPAQPSPDNPYVRAYTVGNYIANAPTIIAAAKAMIAFYGERFVPFPWSGINIIQNANSLGGGYAPLSGIFMLRNIFGAKEGSGYWTSTSELMAHELAHQWWGNLIRPMGNGDVCLSESLAEVSSCMYTEKALNSRQQIIGDNLSYVYQVPTKNDVPLTSPYVYGSPNYVQIVYHKGAVVFDMLRIELGEQPFLDGLAKYAAAFDRDYASVSDLQLSLEEVSGRNLGWYFKQWFHSPGAIHVQFAGRVDPLPAGGWVFRLRTSTLGFATMRFKLPLRIWYTDGTSEDTFMDIIPAAGSAIAVTELKLDKRPRSVRPDLGRRLLRRFEILTPGDVDLNGLVDGADLVETAFRKGRAVVAHGKNGQSYFYPNQGWDELFDIVPDDGHVVDEKDIDLVVESFGSTAIDF